jgi:two-component system cell cycle sensor histidine kinase/response regulator CckA
MRWFVPITVRQKLVALIMLASLLSLLCVVTTAALYDVQTFRPRASAQLLTEAEILEEVLAAPLDFGFQDQAEALLEKHCAHRPVVKAMLYTPTGLFVSYPPEISDAGMPTVAVKAQTIPVFNGNQISIWRTLRNKDGELIGYLYLVEKLPPLGERLSDYLYLTGAVLLALAVVALVLMRGLRRNILDPLAALVETSTTVTRSNAYTARAKVHGPDELGQMATAFNQMIEAVEKRDAKLREVSRRIENVFNSATEVAIISTDPDGVVTVFNTGAERMLGYAAAETIGKLTPLCWHKPEEMEARAADLSRRLGNPVAGFGTFVALTSAGKTEDRDWTFVRKNGSAFEGNMVVTVVHDDADNVTGFLMVVTDITARKQSEERIRQQAALIEVSHDAIMVLDLKRGVQFMNRAAEELTGRALEEARSKPLSFVLHDCSDAELAAAIYHVTTQGNWTGELVIKNGAAASRELANRWIMLKDSRGTSASVLITCNDITEQKKLQAQYLRAQRLESVGTLASGVAHDLNNILSPILMGADMLEVSIDDADLLETVGMMKESARRGSDTVKQLLTFARGADTQKGPVQPRHLLKEIVRLIQQTFPKNIQIYSDFTGQLSTVLADPSQIHQVLMNLCVNARDAMPDGGVLFLRLESVVVDEATAKQHPQARPIPYLVFKVSDSGTGIPPEVIERIFDPFFTTKPQGKGTGLGLSTVLGIVENHGGFLQVESNVGKGTTFQVFIPAQETVMDGPVAEEGAAPPKGQGELVLAVDDEPAILRMIESVLRKSGYETVSATNAAEAIDLYERNRDKIHAVVTDVMMPFGDGRQLVITLGERDPKLPIIAMSGLSSTEFQADLKRRGACMFLPKPFSAEKLLICLAQVLHRSN